jgi:hypothetical protein
MFHRILTSGYSSSAGAIFEGGIDALLNYAKDSRVAVLVDGTRLPVSRSGYARLLEAMGDSQGGRVRLKPLFLFCGFADPC